MESEKKEIAIKKKYKPTIKPVKPKDKKEKKFFDQLPELLISYNIFPFFTVKEAKEIGKINQTFLNCFSRDFFEVRSDSLVKKYNIKLEKEFEPNEIYEQKDDKGHFIKLSFNHLEHFLLFSYFKWTWQEDSRYWNKIKPKNSILNKDVCHLITVCWIDVNANMSHVYSGKYKLYLNHCVCKLAKKMLKMTVFIDNIPLKDIEYPSDEQIEVCRLSHSDKKEENKKEEDKKEENKKEEDKKEEDKKEEDKKEDKTEEDKKEGNKKVDNPATMSVMTDDIRVPFMPGLHRIGLVRGPFRFGRALRRNEPNYNPENKLNKDFVMDIDVIYDEQLDNGNGHEIKVTFNHVDGSWKNNWLIDAVILEKIES